MVSGSNHKDEIRDATVIGVHLAKLFEELQGLKITINEIVERETCKAPTKKGLNEIQKVTTITLKGCFERIQEIQKGYSTVCKVDRFERVVRRTLNDNSGQLSEEIQAAITPKSMKATKGIIGTSNARKHVRTLPARIANDKSIVTPSRQNKKAVGLHDFPRPSPGKFTFSPGGWLRFISKVEPQHRATARKNVIHMKSRSGEDLVGVKHERSLRRLEQKLEQNQFFCIPEKWSDRGQKSLLDNDTLFLLCTKYQLKHPNICIERDEMKEILTDAKKNTKLSKGLAPIGVSEVNNRTADFYLNLLGTKYGARNIQTAKTKNKQQTTREGSLRSVTAYACTLAQHFQPCTKEEEPDWSKITDGANQYRKMMCDYFNCSHVHPIKKELIFGTDDKAVLVTFNDFKKNHGRINFN